MHPQDTSSAPSTPAWPAPLAGTRIVDFSLLLPGPYASHLLQQMGAEVIKVEPPSGDPARQMSPAGFAAMNRGKQSVCVDAAAPGSLDLLMGLIADADVVIEGFRPGVMAKLGLSFEQVKACNPHAIYVSISAYGHTGPYAKRPAHDVNTIAAAGYFATTLDPDHGTLQRPRIRIADYLTGLSAAFFVASLLKVPRAQRPAMHVDASMFDAMAYVMLPILQSASAEELLEPALRNDVVADIAMYRTSDGRGIALAAQEDKYWANFVRALQGRFPELANPAWAGRAGRTQGKQALRATLNTVFGQLSFAEVEALLPPEDVCWSAVLDGRQVLDDPHVAARGLVQPAPTGQAVTSAVAINGARAPAHDQSPKLGEHTQAWRERLSQAA